MCTCTLCAENVVSANGMTDILVQLFRPGQTTEQQASPTCITEGPGTLGEGPLTYSSIYTMYDQFSAHNQAWRTKERPENTLYQRKTLTDVQQFYQPGPSCTGGPAIVV